MSNYYCLVAGLPDLSIDDAKLSYTIEDFKADIYPQLSADDKKVIDLFFLQYDNCHLLTLLRNKDAVIESTRGNYSAEQLAALITAVAEGDAPDKKIPSYMPQFIAWYRQAAESGESNVLPEDMLAAYYYDYATQTSNKFASEWYAFNLNLNNLLSGITARKYKLQAAQYIVGSNEVSEAIRTSTARDFGLSTLFDFYEPVYRITEITDLVEKEKKIDLLKLNWMEEASFFNYFTIEKLFVFLVKISLIERWTSLDKEKGGEVFRKIIDSLKSDVSIPEEFRK